MLEIKSFKDTSFRLNIQAENAMLHRTGTRADLPQPKPSLARICRKQAPPKRRLHEPTATKLHQTAACANLPQPATGISRHNLNPAGVRIWQSASIFQDG